MGDSTPASVRSAVRRASRLEVLVDLDLVDGDGQAELDRLAGLAASVAGGSHAALSIALPDRLHFEGLRSEQLGRVFPVPEELAMCAEVVATGASVEVLDAAASPRWRDNPHVRAGALRTYVGEPVVVDGEVLGSLCVFGDAPLELDDRRRALLADVAGQASEYLTLKRDVLQLRRALALRQEDGAPGRQAVDGADARDGLTGLLTRRGFLAAAVELLRGVAGPHAVVAVDLDRLTVVNDSLGPAHGDDVLRTAAARLREVSRPQDLVARTGGDEFVVLCPGLGPDDAAALGRAVATQLARPQPVAGVSRSITATVGVATADSVDVLLAGLRAAERALLAAKGGGRGLVGVADVAAGHAQDDDSRLELALRAVLDDDALRAQRLSLAYQVQVDLADGRVSGLEALLRWEDPDRGAVPPGRFVELAEHAGLMPELGRHVLREAVRQHGAWARAGDAWSRVVLWVNVSGRQLEEPTFAADVEAVLAEQGMPPGLLGLEITESVVTGRTRAAVEALRAVRALGVQLAIDDFGTGFSNLASLRNAPVDVVKIDRSLMGGIADGDEGARVVDAVLGLATAFGLQVVAEGVETVAQLVALAERDCASVQGYLLGRPVPPSDLPDPAAPVTAWHTLDRISAAAAAVRGEDATGYPSFDEAARAVLRHLRERVGLRLWAITRAAGPHQVVLVADGDDGYGFGEGDALPWEGSLCLRMLGGAARTVPDVDADPAYADAPNRALLPIGAYAGQPLRDHRGDLFGTLCGFDPQAQPEDLRAAEPVIHLFAELLTTLLARELAHDDLRRRAERAEGEATRDALTGVANRRGWTDVLDREEARCRRYGHPAAVIVLDLDGLKTTNDGHGHAAGDRLLRSAADTLRAHARAGDVVARLGGDEFGVLAVQSGADGAHVEVDRLTAALDAAGVSASAGVAGRRPDGSLRLAWEEADAAMYAAKRARR